MIGVLLAPGARAQCWCGNARYREREPDWPRWLEYLSSGKGPEGAGPDIFIGPGRT